MAEYERVKRYKKYSDSSCKVYLRKDFSRCCAYCKTRESDLGTSDNFEIDHFVPKTGGYVGKVNKKYNNEAFDVNSYYNLYYACKRCNGGGGKSDTWSSALLDPCEEIIFGKHISDILTENYEYRNITEQGEEYIQTFKLNSKAARTIRKKIAKHSEDVLSHMKSFVSLKDAVIDFKIKEYLEQEIKKDINTLKYGIRYIPNDFFLDDEDRINAEQVLSKYQMSLCNGDYELDYEIELNGKRYLVYLKIEEKITFIDGAKIYLIPIDQVEDWSGKRIIVCHYDSTLDKMYYLLFSDYYSKNPITTLQKYRYEISDKNLL